MARGRGAQESRTQDYPYTPPRSRYPIRSYRGVVPQQLALPPSGSIARNPSLNSAVRRCLRGDPQAIVVALPSQPAGDYPVYDNGLEDVKPSITTGSPSNSAPCTKITYQGEGEGSQQLAVEPPSHHDEEGNAQPPGENFEVPRYKHALGMISATAEHVPLSPSHSHNVTEFARRLKDESDDEVVSAPDDDYECILRHKVEIGIVDLVRAIVRKYGNITSDCKVRSPPLFSFLLERMCEVYKTLEKKKLVALTRDEVNIMRDELQLCEYHKLKVGWLLERVEEISETMSSFQEYLKLKEEAGRCAESQKSIEMQVEKQWRHIALIKKNISMSEQKMAEEEAKANICLQKASDIRAKVKPLFNQSLVHNLL